MRKERGMREERERKERKEWKERGKRERYIYHMDLKYMIDKFRQIEKSCRY